MRAESESRNCPIVLAGYDTSQGIYDSLETGGIHVVGMNLTSECNYRCPYCFVGAEHLRGSPDEMSTSQKLRTLEQAANCGAKVLIICGKGEPFADVALWRVIETAQSLGLWTVVYTNGSLVPQDGLRRLGEMRVSLMVKVDSLLPADYEASIGYRSPKDDLRGWVLEFKKYLPLISDPGETRRVCRFGINAVVSKANADSIPELSRFCHENQILFSCRVVQPIGDAITNWERLVGGDKERLSKIAREYSMRIVSAQAPNGCCSIYRYGVTIENNGDVYVCPNSRRYQSRIGNVCREDLATLLKRRIEMYPLVPQPGYCFVAVRASKVLQMQEESVPARTSTGSADSDYGSAVSTAEDVK